METAGRADGDGANERAAEMIRYLADIWEEEPMAVGLLLLRCRHSTAPLRELGRRLGIDEAAGVNRLWKSLQRYSPSLARFARGGGTKVHGTEGGRKKQGGQVGL